jgi:SAM-dependent MidA family methyltransferase
VAEVGLQSEAFVREVADHLLGGAAIFLDYGTDGSELVAGHPAGTLAGFRDHRAVLHPLDDPGEVDLSAFVNFSRIRAAGRASGLTEIAYRNQADALGAWGFPALLDAEVGTATDAESLVRTRLAAKNLLFGFGNFRVLEFAPRPRG